MTRVIMHGCNGKMGQTITGICAAETNIKIVAGIDRNIEKKNDYPVYDSLWDCREEADVIIDFSTADAVDGLLDFSREKRIPVVLCTTGLSQQQMEKVKDTSEEVAIMRSANMSLGINVLLKALQEVAKRLAPAGFDIEIVEKHHNQKIDAPSGTAIALADAVNEALDSRYEYIFDRSGKREKRAENEIGISSVRGGSIVGEHDVIFAGMDEVITISHTAYSKAIFAKGAVEAAKFLNGKKPGIYDMQDALRE